MSTWPAGPAIPLQNRFEEPVMTNATKTEAIASPKNTFVLCFDGTGDKFTGTDIHSNILKIYRLLDKRVKNTYHYYQPGIGIYVPSASIDHTSTYARLRSMYDETMDEALGTSLPVHVMAGYKFLMRYYQPGDDIYFFGFSRGSYTARFLADMLDHIGLLSAGNEEQLRFAWEAFSKWQSRRGGNKKKEMEMYEFMTHFRETFCRPVHRVRFLGIFDTVNSVLRFESPWMTRSKFPYTARTSAKVIRHAVSIDERRAKFRQDLITGGKIEEEEKEERRYDSGLWRAVRGPQDARDGEQPPGKWSRLTPSTSGTWSNNGRSGKPGSASAGLAVPPRRSSTINLNSAQDPPPAIPFKSELLRGYSTHRKAQDIEEVWFPGSHGDIGGGWQMMPGEIWPLSHMPLVWMVLAAEEAGVKFDPVKLAELSCCPNDIDEYGNKVPSEYHADRFRNILTHSGTRGFLHDCLELGRGLSVGSVLAWNLLEWLPFRRMDMRKDGTWRAIRWPLPRGEPRDIPDDAKIHNSAIKRLEARKHYRPGNLIVGGGGRRRRIAPRRYGIGAWRVKSHEGDVVRETYVRRNEREMEEEDMERAGL